MVHGGDVLTPFAELFGEAVADASARMSKSALARRLGRNRTSLYPKSDKAALEVSLQFVRDLAAVAEWGADRTFELEILWFKERAGTGRIGHSLHPAWREIDSSPRREEVYREVIAAYELQLLQRPDR